MIYTQEMSMSLRDSGVELLNSDGMVEIELLESSCH